MIAATAEMASSKAISVMASIDSRSDSARQAAALFEILVLPPAPIIPVRFSPMVSNPLLSIN